MSTKQPSNKTYDSMDGKILAGLLNGFKIRFPRRYTKCARLIREFEEIASGKPIPYNLFHDSKERTLFQQKKGRRAYLVNGEMIFATDPRDVLALAIDRLNLRLERYLTYPVVNFEPKGRRKGRWTVEWESPSHVGNIVYRIVRLAEFGLLERMRQCRHCKEWYFAHHINMVFCSSACSKMHWQIGGAGKEYRRGYMRSYMRERRKQEK